VKTIFEKSIEDNSGDYLPKLDIPSGKIIPDNLIRLSNNLPELSELELTRHYTNLSKRNFGVDTGFYPLGSCTMKYNPKVSEDVARLEKFDMHPYSDEFSAQGCLELMYNLQSQLLEITGMDALTLQPAAGAQGELAGLMIVKKYFKTIGERRTRVLTPDSSHGTNPASASMCNFKAAALKSNEKGQIDLDALKENLTNDVAALMLTIPNTLGIFEEQILEITKLAHDNGTLVYMDGANLNALLGIVKPKDIGIDILHINLHKTVATPHGGGGPGSGPVAVTKELSYFLPVPTVEKTGIRYQLNYDRPKSIGRVKSFYGNFGVMVKAFTYITALGAEGLKRVSQHAVLNANYLKKILKSHYNLKYDIICKHEFVLDDSKMPNNITTADIAKRLLDYGFHPPTIYFPLIVPGAIMIEPTETENKETLDEFATALIKIKQEAQDSPELVKNAPHKAVVKRLDNVKAARNPVLKYSREPH
jgi:glycine dehydrogenase subunit 2